MALYSNEIDIKIFNENAIERFDTIIRESLTNKENNYLPGIVEIFKNYDNVYSGYGDRSMSKIFFNEDRLAGALTISDIAKSLDTILMAVSFREADDCFYVYLFDKNGEEVRHTSGVISKHIEMFYSDIKDYHDAVTLLEDDVMSELFRSPIR